MRVKNLKTMKTFYSLQATFMMVCLMNGISCFDCYKYPCVQHLSSGIGQDCLVIPKVRVWNNFHTPLALRPVIYL